MSDPYATLPQSWPRPSHPRPIVIIGAGGIVRAAHLPVYRRLDLPVAGLQDLDPARARETAAQFGVPRVHESLAEAAATPGAVFDLALPGDQILAVLEEIPDGAGVLIQKPLGRDLPEARRIVALCRRKRLVAAMNFQLRFAPNMLALAAALRSGLLGEVVDVEVRINTHTPWSNWKFMEGIPRLELLYHSIHYLDLLRHLLGEPRSLKSSATPDPRFPGYADTRSATILDYPGGPQVRIHSNHHHAHGPRHAASELRLDGTRGAAWARMGVNLDYPVGEPDTLEFARGAGWQSVELRGSWFTEAFEGPMCNLQRHLAGEDEKLVSPVDDAIRTMAVVEACYLSAARPGTPVEEP